MSNGDNSYQDLTALLGGMEDTSSGPLNTLQKMLTMTGNPLFLYMQGVISAEDLQNAVLSATTEAVDFSNADYVSIENADYGDPVLMKAYGLVKQGMSTPAVMAQILRDYEDKEMIASGKMSKDIEYIEASIENFKDAWDAAQKLESGINSGEYMVNADGTVSKRMDYQTASSILSKMGMPAYLQNPDMWNLVGDPDILARAAAKNDEASGIIEELNKTLLTPAQQNKRNKAVAQTGTQVYQDFLKKTPEGQKLLKQVTTGKTNLEKTQEAKEGLLKNAISILIPGSGTVRGVKRSIGWATGGAKRLGNLVGIGDDKDNEKPKSVVAQNQDYWAKLAGSYAARAKYEQGQKPIRQKQTAADKAIEDARALARLAAQKGSVPALSMVQQALPLAQMFAMSGGGGSSPAPRPKRQLSDEEIDRMSSMLASGGSF